MQKIRSPFLFGWVIINTVASVPLVFSFVFGLILDGFDIENLLQDTTFKSSEDLSYIFNYFAFGVLHIILCIAITFYVYDILKNSSSLIFCRLFLRQHILAFLFVSLLFLTIIIVFDTPIEILSSDLLWIGLEKITKDNFLFTPIEIGFNLQLYPFDIAPILLVIAAFMPVSAIILLIPRLVERLELNFTLSSKDTHPENIIIKKFFAEFQVIYYLLVTMLISSSVATYFYLKTPLAMIDQEKSTTITNMLDSVFSIWSIVFVLVLLIILFFAYGLMSYKIKLASKNINQLIDPEKYNLLREYINFHFLITQEIKLFASAFSPLFIAVLTQAFS